MHIHVLQHVEFEGLGSIANWITGINAQLTWTRFYANDILPPLSGIDLLIILGGPMSIHDEDEYPWLIDEKIFLSKALQNETAVLGICLGSQLIATVCGAQVYPALHKEIGWFPIYGVEETDKKMFRLPNQLEAFHWHGETFDLPTGSQRLAYSASCENQAFQIGTKVIGLQFHLESTQSSIDDIIHHCADELIPNQPYIQSAYQLYNASSDCFFIINTQMYSILEYLTSK